MADREDMADAIRQHEATMEGFAREAAGYVKTAAESEPQPTGEPMELFTAPRYPAGCWRVIWKIPTGPYMCQDFATAQEAAKAATDHREARHLGVLVRSPVEAAMEGLALRLAEAVVETIVGRTVETVTRLLTPADPLRGWRGWAAFVIGVALALGVSTSTGPQLVAFTALMVLYGLVMVYAFASSGRPAWATFWAALLAFFVFGG